MLTQPEYYCILQMKKRIHKMLETTRFAGCQVVPVAAKPGGPEVRPGSQLQANSFMTIMS